MRMRIPAAAALELLKLRKADPEIRIGEHDGRVEADRFRTVPVGGSLRGRLALPLAPRADAVEELLQTSPDLRALLVPFRPPRRRRLPLQCVRKDLVVTAEAMPGFVGRRATGCR